MAINIEKHLESRILPIPSASSFFLSSESEGTIMVDCKRGLGISLVSSERINALSRGTRFIGNDVYESFRAITLSCSRARDNVNPMREEERERERKEWISSWPFMRSFAQIDRIKNLLTNSKNFDNGALTIGFY